MKPTCTCLPLNRRLMAHMLKVDEGSVHEQGCVENAAQEAVTRVLDALDEWTDVGIYPDNDRTPWQDGWNAACIAIAERIEQHRPKGGPG